MTIHYLFFNHTLGEVLMASDGKGLCFVGFTDNDRSSALDDLKARLKEATLFQEGTDDHLREGLTFLTSRTTEPCRVPLLFHGTPFQKEVWKALMNIPFGERTSYKTIAEQIGRPKAVRAVGTAIGRNNLSIIVPCHRVLTSSGELGGYHWGIERKKKLLEYEQQMKRS